MWRQHLYSARTHNHEGKAEDAHILTSEMMGYSQFTDRVLEREGRLQERRVAFIQDCGDRLYIGLDGKVPNVLGKDSPYAYEQKVTRKGLEQGREITFVHGYFAPKGTFIPDLDELEARQRKDLKEILSRANGDEERAKADNGAEGIRVEPVAFTRPREKGTDWDRLATAFESGKLNPPMQGMTFTVDGKAFHPLKPTEREKAQPAKPATDEARENDAKKKPPVSEGQQEKTQAHNPRAITRYPVSSSDGDQLARDPNRHRNVETDRKNQVQERTGKPGSQQIGSGGVRSIAKGALGWIKKELGALVDEADQERRK